MRMVERQRHLFCSPTEAVAGAQLIVGERKDMATGVVRLFCSSKHYGFIRSDSDGRDIFIHLSAVQLAGLKDLRKGQKVGFEIFDNRGRPAAKNLRIDATSENRPEDTAIYAGAARGWQFMSPKGENQSKGRTPITRDDLERALTEAVKNSHPECEPFVGVIIEHILPKSTGEANWAVKGIKYGKADRERCGAALSGCVNERQLEFNLSE